MRKVFYNDGPVEVAREDYVCLMTHTELLGSVKICFRGFLSELLPDGERRLLIRNALGQSWKAYGEAINVCYRSETNNESFGDILRVGDDKKGKVLRQALSERPKLLQEFLEEFLYRLENKTLPQVCPGDWDDRADIIAVLFSLTDPLDKSRFLVDEPTVRKLLRYHPANSSEIGRRERYNYLVALWAEPGLPAWLRTETWLQIEAGVRDDVAKHGAMMTERGSYYECYSNGRTVDTSAIDEVIDYISKHQYSEGKAWYAVVDCLRLLDTELPENVPFYDLYKLFGMALRIKDYRLVYRVLGRHVMGTAADSNEFGGQVTQNALFMLLGICYRLMPKGEVSNLSEEQVAQLEKDQALLQKIDKVFYYLENKPTARKTQGEMQ